MLILHADTALCVFFRQWLEPLGWTVDCRNLEDDFALTEGDQPPALILMDADIGADRRATFVTGLRALPGPVAGTPLLLIAAPGEPGQTGIAGRIATPLRQDEATVAIERWAGPVADHGFRDLSAPHYRMVRLAGRESADRLLRSFADQVEAALMQMDEGGDIRRAAHNIAGLAGTLGYGDLSRLWSGVERAGHGDADPAAARTATRAVIDELNRLLPRQ